MPATRLLLFAMLWVALDQATKALVVSRLAMGEAASLPGIAIRRVLNASGASNASARALTVLWTVEAALLVALVQYGPFCQSATAQAALGTALGGAGGNLIDRIARGGVVDFIDLRFWPVFNLADVAITLGVLVGALHA